MAKNKVSLKLRTYSIISDTIRDAIPGGINKFLKHYNGRLLTVEDVEALADKVHDYIMLDLEDKVDWEKS